MSRYFLSASVVVRPETFSSVKGEFRIVRTGFGNEMQKELRVAVHTKPFTPMFDLGHGIDASVPFAHFNFWFPTMRRFEMNNRPGSAFWNLDRHRHRDFASCAIDVPRQQFALGVAARVRISRRQLKPNQAAHFWSDPFQNRIESAIRAKR